MAFSFVLQHILSLVIFLPPLRDTRVGLLFSHAVVRVNCISLLITTRVRLTLCPNRLDNYPLNILYSSILLKNLLLFQKTIIGFGNTPIHLIWGTDSESTHLGRLWGCFFPKFTFVEMFRGGLETWSCF